MRVEVNFGRKISNGCDGKPMQIEDPGDNWHASSDLKVVIEGSVEEAELFLNFIKRYYTLI